MKRLQIALLASMLAVSARTSAQSSSVATDNGAQILQPSFSITVSPLRESVEKEAGRLASARPPGSTTAAPQRQRNWARRHPVLLGTLTGLGVGLAINAAKCGGSSDYTCAGLAAFFGGIGAGIGAGVGGVVAIVSR